jgi:hypothetical protein
MLLPILQKTHAHKIIYGDPFMTASQVRAVTQQGFVASGANIQNGRP